MSMRADRRESCQTSKQLTLNGSYECMQASEYVRQYELELKREHELVNNISVDIREQV